jgi:hypothetical protein
VEKLVYLLYESEEAPGADLRDALLRKSAPALRVAGATRIAVNVNDEDVAEGGRVWIRKSDPPIRAMVSFWLENADDREPCEDALRERAAGLAGYLVAESVPLVNTRQVAPPGERTPGVNMVTCINRPADMAYEAFIDHWHGDHKVVALETQSTFAYVRNVVVRPLTKEAPPFDGIVEEGFPIGALADPHVWYAADSDATYQANLARMIESCQAFLDFEPLESNPMSEYLLG